MSVCEKDKCCGCGACVTVCPKEAVRLRDDMFHMEAVIDEKSCIGCKKCEAVCPVNNPPALMHPIKWMQGWAKDEKIRKSSSSGGFAKVLGYEFTDRGGFVVSCAFENGDFIFKTASTREEINAFTGSKYVKSNPSGCYGKIQKLLKEGKKVLFIGLPCQAAALKNYIGETYRENLLIVDLICHGTPSRALLEKFLDSKKKELKNLQNISFRHKDDFRLNGEKSFSPAGVPDPYSLGFLNGLFYTENCYQCRYAGLDRISDITIGDSWGSEFWGEGKKGISLILCQTKKGVEWAEKLEFVYHEVDLKKAVEANHQLQHPSKKPFSWEKIIKEVKEGKSFSRIFLKYYPKKYLKQVIKTITAKLHLKNWEGEYRLGYHEK